jgi:diazepam-binding inhibitor (GABA receptor modulator, acyl-CoA-binding protein)
MTFEKAAIRVKSLGYDPGNDTKLRLYALYKQATVGDNDRPQPGVFSFTAREKWKAWDRVRGKSVDVAKREYIVLVNSLFQ